MRLHVIGVDLNQGDYDSRTPIHLASSGGNQDVVEYLVLNKGNLSKKDISKIKSCMGCDIYLFTYILHTT